ncbi:hypothetical protein DPEC_G00028280 [Dallia pectoralis]|uniref:Uncharacterized protein n=1 Tax=Dallia pectoralis TaxID=75939 RepID=A0ACC2HIC0_DALPE|nr:hypothetical protein DPEC_G00028280 [Dallia pectoralis]
MMFLPCHWIQYSSRAEEGLLGQTSLLMEVGDVFGSGLNNGQPQNRDMNFRAPSPPQHEAPRDDTQRARDRMPFIGAQQVLVDRFFPTELADGDCFARGSLFKQ